MQAAPCVLLPAVLLCACGQKEADSAPPRVEVEFPEDSASDCAPTEVACDGQDDDCDGEIDEGLVQTFYKDADGDGFGGTVSVERCPDGVAGWSQRDGDCNDEDDGIGPHAPELCNELDDDCDGEIDDGLSVPTWYVDGDDDGWGDAALVACERPEGTSPRDGDCDDTTATTHPGAVEQCGDAVDNDCDGAVDDVSVCCTTMTADTERYLLCPDPLAWDAARDACETDGWQLVVVDDEAERAWLDEVVAWSSLDLWLGLSDWDVEGEWRTVDGRDAPLLHWRSGQPDDSTGIEPDGQDCAMVDSTDTRWLDTECTASHAYFCELP
jgi:hypothetical protein